MGTRVALGGALVLLPWLALADGRPLPLEEVLIIGDRDKAAQVAGSAYVLTTLELERFEFGDINRIISQAPGVYFQEEEGYGLRPNIGIRGAGGGRSSKITVMEDGLLVAPAPYADSAAYYFPTAARVSGVEVLKGPQTLRYGPYTVGGAINLVSTPIPDAASGFANVEFGQYGEQRQHLHYGATQGQWGFLLETHQHKADGFHDIDRSDRDTGFDKQDYVAKLRWQSAPGAALPQYLELKLNRAEEVSDSSYLGVTDAQFRADPYRRYSATQLDRMDLTQTGRVLRHGVAFSEALRLTTTVYRNEFTRSWYKLDRMAGQSLGSIVANANAGNAAAIAMLNGTQDATGVQVKDNARDYLAQGVQAELAGQLQAGRVSHDWVLGGRWHEDESSRFQPVDVFNQVNGSLVYQTTLLPGSGDNRVDAARAQSFWLLDRIGIGAVELTASLRYEDIDTDFERYADLSRSTLQSWGGNDTREWLAGLGATWSFHDNWLLLAGVNQGFAPAGGGALDGTEPEKSVNYEAGLRYRDDLVQADLIGFYSDFSNTVFNCSVANPCTGGIEFGSESLGEARIQGAELSLSATLLQAGRFTVPARLAYTYTETEIVKDADNGSTLEGDNLPDVPRHVFNLSLGLEHDSGARTWLAVRYMDESCVDVTCRRIGSDPSERFRRTEDYWVFDLSTSYPLTPSAEVYARIDNLLDEQAIVARNPAGARSNKPRTGYLGVRLYF